MDEYINKQQILEKAKSHQGSPFGVPLIIAEIEKADAVELVRCKEYTFKYDTRIGMRCGHPSNIIDNEVQADSFCSYGTKL